MGIGISDIYTGRTVKAKGNYSDTSTMIDAYINGTLSELIDYTGDITALSFPLNLPNIKKVVLTSCSYVSGAFSNITSATVSSYATFDLGSVCTVIGDSTFSNVHYSISLSFPPRLSYIGHNAFNKSIYTTNEIPETLEFLGNYTLGYLAYTKYFDKTNLPNIRYLGSYAFKYATSSSSQFKLPETLEYVHNSAFYYGSWYSDIDDKFVGTASPTNSYFFIRNLTSAYSSSTSLITSLPTSVVLIGNSLNLRSVENINDCVNIRGVGEKTFYNNNLITELNLPNLRYVGSSAFEACYELGKLTLPEGLKQIGSYAFSGCRYVTELSFPSSLKVVGAGAFYNTAAISLTIPATMYSYAYTSTGFGSRIAQVRCMNDDIYNYFKANWSTISPSDAVLLSKNDADVLIRSNNFDIFRNTSTTYVVANYAGSSSSITLPDRYNGVTIYSVRSSAFVNQENLTNVTIPDSYKYLPSNMFSRCYSLKELTLPSAAEDISPYMAQYCNKLYDIHYRMPNYSKSIYYFSAASRTHMIIENTVQSIGSSQIFRDAEWVTFNNCTSITSLANSLFYSTSYLSRIDFINTPLQTIGAYAFSGKRYLASIALPSTLTEIGSYAFNGCQNLTQLTLTSKITTIGSNAFANCPKLVEIRDLRATPMSPGSYNTPADARILTEDDPSVIQLTSDGIQIFEYENNKYKILGYNGQIEGADIVVPSMYNGNSIYDVRSYAFANCSDINSVVFEEGIKTFNQSVFANNSGIKSVTIPDTVTTLPTYTFYNCSSLNSVVIGSGVTSVSNLFYNCSKIEYLKFNPNSPITSFPKLFNSNSYIKTLILPDHLEFLATSAFDYCRYLQDITIPNTITSIPENAFRSCFSLKNVIMPSTINLISTNAFLSCSGLSNMNIPQDVSIIGTSAFMNCTGLETVTFSSALTEIGTQAFYNCTALKTANLPSSLESIGNSAFYSCKSLESVSIPKNLTSMGLFAFGYCYNLQSLTLNSKLTTIPYYAFAYCSSLESVSIPKGVTTVGSSAFYYCAGLKEVYLPSTLTSMSNYAFYGCNNLEKIHITNLVKLFSISGANLFPTSKTGLYLSNKLLSELSIPSAITSIPNALFNSCATLTSVYTGNNTSTIGNNAFCYCSNLESVTFSDSLKSIGASAFYGCAKLTSVTLPSTLEAIGSYAFYSTGLTTFEIPDSLVDLTSNIVTSTMFTSINSLYYLAAKNNAYHALMYGSNTVSNVILNDNTKCIAASAFYNKSSVTLFSAGSNLEYIGNYAFYSCSKLSSVTLNNKLKHIGNSAFYSCRSITSMVLPETVDYIGDCAFYSCYSMTSINLPNSISYIGSSAFYYCYSVQISSFPNNLTYIGSSAFSGCRSLQTCLLPDTVSYIGSYAFYNCYGISQLKLPANLTAIESSTFNYCYGILSITIPSLVSYVGSYAFCSCSSTLTLEFEYNTKLTSIGQSAFYRLINIPSIDLSPCTKLSSIGSYAFAYCSSASTITLPKNIETIGSYAFYGCSNVQTINFDFGCDLTTLYPYAFANCYKLEGVDLTYCNKLESMYSAQFLYCSALKYVYMPSTLSFISGPIFSGCSVLSEVYFTEHESIPKLSGNLFYNYSSVCTVYVPSSLYSSWIKSTYWSNISSRIQGV